MSSWLVKYEATVRGTAQVEADTKDEAEDKIERGDFEIDNTVEMVNWKRLTAAREDT